MAGNIVWLAWVSHSKVISESDALAGEPGEIWISGSLVVVGVFEPDGDKPVENLATDMAGFVRSSGSGLRSVYRRSTCGRIDVGLSSCANDGERAESEYVHCDRTWKEKKEATALCSQMRVDLPLLEISGHEVSF